MKYHFSTASLKTLLNIFLFSFMFMVACDDSSEDDCANFSLDVSGSETEITLEITAGTAPYSYEITYTGGDTQTGSTDNTSSTVTASVFEGASIELTDANGCTTTATLDEGVLFDPCEDLTATAVGSGTEITLTITEGTAPFEYEITYTDTEATVQSSNTSEEVTVIEAEVYESASIVITDASGCSETITLGGTLTDPCDGFTLEVEGDETEIEFDIEGGTAPFDYIITYDGGDTQSGSTSDRGEDVEAEVFEAATIELTDSNGCITTAELDEGELEDPCEDFEIEAIGSDGEITITVEEGEAPFDYVITYEDDSNTTQEGVITDEEREITFSANVTAAATVVITDAIGCEKEADFTAEHLTSFYDFRDGQRYSMVTINDQVWLGENFNYDTETDSYCYENVDTNCDDYGKLYTWAAVKTDDFAPEGWRVPTKDDAETLKSYLGDDPGDKLKEGGSSGFEAILAGIYIVSIDVYGALGDEGDFWTQTDGIDDEEKAFRYKVDIDNSDIAIIENDKSNAQSVRLIKINE